MEAIVSASFDQTIRIWNSETGWHGFSPFGRSYGLVQRAVFSPDGRRCVRFSWWNHSHLEFGDRRNDVGSFESHTDYVFSAVFSPWTGSSCRPLLTKPLHLDPAAGHCLGPLEGHQDMVCFAGFSADGRHILSCSKTASSSGIPKLEKEFTLPLRVRVLSCHHLTPKLPLTIITPRIPTYLSKEPLLCRICLVWRMAVLASGELECWYLVICCPCSYILIGRYTGQLMLISYEG